MLKTIPIQQLSLGMYVHEIPGPWINHPFWRESFKLEKEEDLKVLRVSKISEIVIDTSKGCNVTVAEQELPETTTTTEKPKVTKVAVPVKRISLSAEQERVNASKILTASKQAIKTMFNETRMGKTVDLKQVIPLVQEITASVSRNSDALISLARLKNADDYTYMHSVAVCALMISLAKELGLSEDKVREAGMAGLLHDIGKMAVPLEILNKPGKLTDAEFVSIRKHAQAGHAILLGVHGIDEAALDVALHHHEKVDGSGYPFNLAGEQISLVAKMGAICDVYDATTSNRPYKKGWDPALCIKRMANNEGHFDKHILEAFIKSVGIYPTGSCVLMQSGKVGIIIDQHPKSLLTPIVKVFFSARSMSTIPIEQIDLSSSHCSDKIVSYADTVKLQIPQHHIDLIWSPVPAY